MDTIGNHLAAPLGRAVIALEVERRNAVVETVAPGSDKATLRRSRETTDQAVAVFLKEARDDAVRDASNSTVRAGVDKAVKSLGTLTAIRSGVATHKMTKSDVLTSYTAITSSIAEALRPMTILPDQDAQDFGQALYTLVPAGDILSQEDALISAAGASPTRRLSTADYKAVVQAIGAHRLLNAQAIAQLPPTERAPFLKFAAPGGAMARLATMEEQILSAGPDARELPFPIEQWRSAFDTWEEASGTTALNDIALVFTHTGPPARQALVELISAGLLGLTALVVSVVMSVRMTRSLLGDIERLRSSSRNLTEDQLRDVVGRLRRGESVDVRAGMTRRRFVNREMAELGAAFDALQLTAVDLAREDVRLHEGMTQLFVNLARRSQVLVNRQLSMLDEMERHEEDARTLNRLFELDQLATRMRRYAEGLLIVSGTSPGRFWRRPVPAVDVVRGGIAETEQYARVVVMPVPPVGIQGRAAADVIHLLAELIENAEAFSSADSEVRICVGTADSGLIIEIDDRGLGMPPEELAAANERLNVPLEVSTLDSTRLGLVTVGRLAQRHHIEVTLRRSPFGGVSAIVLIPAELLETDAAVVESASALPRAGVPKWAGQGPAAIHGAPRAELASVGQSRIAASHAGRSPEAPPGEISAASEPAGRSRAHLAPQPNPSTVPPVLNPHGVPGKGETIDGLPRRVPQASLAGELTADAARGQLMDWGNVGQEHHYVGGIGWGGTPPQPDGVAISQEAAPYWQAAAAQQPDSPERASSPGAAEVADGRVSPGAAPYAGTSTYAGGRPYSDMVRAPAHESLADRPEQVRSMMSALQAGAARARVGQYTEPGEGGEHPRPVHLSQISTFPPRKNG
ncbi:nitrate- and nitrite sensing domain-containing protein [Streptomyces sp. NPDC087901]|uniref:sensor histidine kinase n=1 Tax=Streptomyces sp. NPDC087901 TaxID=3365818 RepID=UPI00381BA3EB